MASAPCGEATQHIRTSKTTLLRVANNPREALQHIGSWSDLNCNCVKDVSPTLQSPDCDIVPMSKSWMERLRSQSHNNGITEFARNDKNSHPIDFHPPHTRDGKAQTCPPERDEQRNNHTLTCPSGFIAGSQKRDSELANAHQNDRVCHCERSEAIQTGLPRFRTTFAMTNTNAPQTTIQPLNRSTSQLNKRCAFTLAEVLITLAIIGVVAAITLHTVINDIRGKQLETALKKGTTVIQQTIMNINLEESKNTRHNLIGFPNVKNQPL